MPGGKASWDGSTDDAKAALADRIAVVARLFSSEGFFGDDPALAAESTANQAALLWQHFRRSAASEMDYLVTAPLSAAVREFQPPAGPHKSRPSAQPSPAAVRPQRKSRPLQIAPPVGPRGGDAGEPALGGARGALALERAVYGSWLRRKMILLTRPKADFHGWRRPGRRCSPTFMPMSRSSTRRADRPTLRSTCGTARPPDDETGDSRANQELLRLPGATDALIADHQRKWVSRHVAHPAAMSRHR